MLCMLIYLHASDSDCKTSQSPDITLLFPTVRVFNLDLGLIIGFNGEASGKHDEHFVAGIIERAAVAVESRQCFFSLLTGWYPCFRVAPLFLFFLFVSNCAFLELPF